MEFESYKNTLIGNYLSNDEIEEAKRCGKIKILIFPKDTMIHNVGEVCTYLEIVLTGKIVAMQLDRFGNYLYINNLVSNDIISGNILFADKPQYPLSFMARTKVSTLKIDKEYLFELLTKRSDILRKYLNLTCNRANSLGNNPRLYIKKSIREHLVEYLDSESLKQNSKIIVLPISKKELADLFSVQRTSVSREFARMEKDGLIVIKDNNTIELLSIKHQ